jgi:hypothetical protein
MRVAARIDKNQPEIVSAFRKFGWSVLHLHTIGKGCPDILVSKNHQSILVEIKDGSKCPSAQALTPDEQDFHAGWQGRVVVINGIDGVINLNKELTA